jgi:acetylornithine deacetylase/succinyl-diaminopimelate desuccinylase-like protein
MDQPDHGARARAFEADVRHLASFPRPSASDGERRAAEWLAERLRELGADVRVEQERAHGGYWWPIGVLNAAAAMAAAGALRGRSPRARMLASATGAAAVCALWDDMSGGRQWFRKAIMPTRSTWNVVGEVAPAPNGESSAPAQQPTVVLVAHHDAAHSGLVFHPALGRLFADRFPALHARSTQTAPIMYLTVLGPALVGGGALLGRRGLLRWGIAFALGTAAVMTDIGARDVVPGANDNLSSVAVLLAVAGALRERPVAGLRVILLSTGSEESFMEGMRGFARRHFSQLPADTRFLCLECLGGPTLTLLEGEGMLRMRDYPAAAREALAMAAKRAGVTLARNLRTVAATDALVAMRAGFSVALLASVAYTHLPANYHWRSDTPDNLVWETIGQAIAVTEQFVRDAGAAPDRPAQSATAAVQ